MATVKVLAGYLPSGSARYSSGHIEGVQLESVAIATEQNVKKAGGTLAGGVVGGVLLGPLGAVGGMLVGGNKKEIVFVAKFTNGHQALVQADSNIYTRIQADIFNGPIAPVPEITMANNPGMALGAIIGFVGGFIILNNYLWALLAFIVALIPAYICAIIGGVIAESGNSKKDNQQIDCTPPPVVKEKNDNYKYHLKDINVSIWTVPMNTEDKHHLFERLRNTPKAAYTFIWPEILVDWEGVKNENSENIPFSKRNVELLGEKRKDIFSKFEEEIKKSITAK